MSFAVSDLHVAYGRQRVIEGLGFSPAARGEVTALIGPNASGKSTLFRCIAGLVRHRCREMVRNGEDLSPLPSRERVKRVCYVPQQVLIRAVLTVFEVVLLARQQGRRRWTTDPSDVAATEAALAELGIDDLGGRDVQQLSGGQQQLVAIAQARVRDPRLVLLDEPTSALDLRRQLEVMELVRRMTRTRNMITVVALHDLNLAARYADRILLLREGRIAADGSPAQVLASDALGAAYGVDVALVAASEGRLLVDARLPCQSIGSRHEAA